MSELFDDELLKLNSEKQNKKKSHRRTTELKDIETKDEYRRAFGVQNLLKVMGLEKPKSGHSYHIITGGNVDLIAHIRWLMLHWPKLKRIFISAWAISVTDILLLKRWHEDGQIDEADILVGDIFPSQYKNEWNRLKEYYNSGFIKNLYSSSIHSKLILIETYEGECIIVESSANCNMNPRIEQSVVTLNNDLYNFYIDYFKELFEAEKYTESNKAIVKLELDTPLCQE